MTAKPHNSPGNGGSDGEGSKGPSPSDLTKVIRRVKREDERDLSLEEIQEQYDWYAADSALWIRKWVYRFAHPVLVAVASVLALGFMVTAVAIVILPHPNSGTTCTPIWCLQWLNDYQRYAISALGITGAFVSLRKSVFYRIGELPDSADQETNPDIQTTKWLIAAAVAVAAAALSITTITLISINT